MSFLYSCDSVLDMPSITSGADVCKVLQSIGGFSPDDFKLITAKWNGVIEIKRLLILVETARQGEGGTLGERFLEICKRNINWGYE